MTEPSDDELERQMRRKLFLDGPSRRAITFTEEEQRIADKLLGKTESQRLQNRRDNSRPFKPKPPLVVAEYFEVPPQESRYGGVFGGGWRIDVRENGVVRNSKSGLDREECMTLIARLSRRGVQTKLIETEWMKHEAERRRQETRPKRDCRRKSFSERYGDFDPEVDG